VLSTFADDALEHGLIVNRAQEAHVAIRSAAMFHGPPSDLRLLFAIGVKLGANFEALSSAFSERLGDESDDLPAIRMKRTKFSHG
jgi:hypothetical protein